MESDVCWTLLHRHAVWPRFCISVHIDNFERRSINLKLYLKTYHISGNFQFVKIFVMEIFDRGNLQKGQPFAKFIYIQVFTLTKITRVKMQGWTKVPYFLEYMPRPYWYFLRCFGTGVETRQTFNRGHAASIQTTRLLRKDCLAGYRHKKAAVISENHTTLHTCHVAQYRNC